MKKVKLLYAEDDETLAYLTKDRLEENGYEVSHCANGNECLARFKNQTYDLCILDVMLPGFDGFEIVSRIRQYNPHIPVLFLSAKSLKEDRIKGLRLGADDYLVKPFSMEELLLKIEVFLNRPRKTSSAPQATYHVGRYMFNTSEFFLEYRNEKITLTRREAELLKFFLDNKNEVLKREYILTTLWGDDDYFMGRSLDVFISRLRKILAAEKNISIENLHGVGFKYSEGV